MSADDQPDRETRKSRYESILRIVDAQTGGPDINLSASVKMPQIKQLAMRHLAWEDADPSQVTAVVKRAVENDDLITVRDRDNPQQIRFVRTTEDCLRDYLHEETNQDHPRKTEVATVNQALADDAIPQTETQVVSRHGE